MPPMYIQSSRPPACSSTSVGCPMTSATSLNDIPLFRSFSARYTLEHAVDVNINASKIKVWGKYFSIYFNLIGSERVGATIIPVISAILLASSGVIFCAATSPLNTPRTASRNFVFAFQISLKRLLISSTNLFSSINFLSIISINVSMFFAISIVF